MKIKTGVEYMKKFLPLCIVGILVISGLGTSAITSNKTNELKLRIESIALSEPEIQDEGQYVRVILKEATSSFFEQEKPMLPVITKVFTFPFGTKITDVKVSFSKINKLGLSKEVTPVPEPTRGDAKLPNELIKDLGVYASAELYPAKSYSYTIGAGLEGKEHVIYLAIHCYPIRYSPANNLIYYSENAVIEITYREPTAPTVFFDQYDLVIIAPKKFSNSLEPLINHKISMGVNTTLKPTEEIYDEYSGFDNAEKIKYFIKDAIENWGIDYVLLVGNIEKVPIRTTWYHERHHEHYWNETILTDLYYADIYDVEGDFCSWDSNGNGLYGEIYLNCPGVDDVCDFYPDINIGRLPCTKSTEVKTVVSKIIHYETETAGKSWFKNLILVGGDTFPDWNGNEGEEKNLLTEQIMSDFTPVRLWTSDGTFTAQSLNQAINQGAGFIDYAGHGFEFGVGTHPPNNETWIYYQTHNLLGAFNGYKLPIIFFDACLTAKLDFNFSELVSYMSEPLQEFVNKFSFIASRLVPTFAWCIVKKRNGGAIATIGATRTASGGIDMGCGYFSLRFYEAYATSESVSQMLTQAQNNYITFIPFDRFTVEEFILIGDPSLKIGGY